MPETGWAQWQHEMDKEMAGGKVFVTSIKRAKGKQAVAVGVFKADYQTVWRVLQDYNHFAEFMPRVNVCRLVKARKDTSWVEYLFDMPSPFSDLRYTLRIVHDWKNKRITWILVSGDLDAKELSRNNCSNLRTFMVS